MKKVVIADDNKKILEQLEKGLRENNLIDIVGIASNGEEELKYIEQFLPDIVITDIEMPKKNGIDVIETVKDFKKVPDFIVITGGADKDIMQRLYQLPIKKICYKPVDIQMLIDEILLMIDKTQTERLEKSLKKEKNIIVKLKRILKEKLKNPE